MGEDFVTTAESGPIPNIDDLNVIVRILKGNKRASEHVYGIDSDEAKLLGCLIKKMETFISLIPKHD